MMRHVIEDGLWLEFLRPTHVEELFELVDSNRDHLRPWLPWVDQTRGPSEIETFIRNSLNRFADGKGFELGLWCDGCLVGVLGLYGADNPNRSAMIGYWIAHAQQGRGLMTKACRALLDHAFGELELHRIEIRCAAENRRSQAIPERLGFCREGLLREAEKHKSQYVDLVMFSILSQEWKERDAGM